MYTYCFTDTTASIIGPGAVFNLSGDGVGNAEEGITFEYEDDKGSITSGADGSGMHNLMKSRKGKCTIRLLKASKINGLLSIAYALQQTSGALWGKNIIRATNFTSGDVIVLSQTAFIKHSNINYAREGGTNEWTFRGVYLDALLGVGT